MEILIIILTCCSVVTGSVLRSRMPLLDTIKTPLFAELDASLVNKQIKEYIDGRVEKQVNDNFNQSVRDLLKRRQTEVNSKALEEYFKELNKTQVSLVEQFNSQSHKFEQDIDKLDDSVQELQNSFGKLKNSVEELQKSFSEIKPGGMGVGTNRPIDCGDIDIERGSGTHRIYPKGSDNGIYVYCDMSTGNIYGGWTVFQRRLNNVTDFYRDWDDYKFGFGDVKNEFWLGNRNLHRLTSQGHYDLRVVIEDFQGKTSYAHYRTFYVGDESEKYKLTVGNYSGTAGDSLKNHNGRSFSTKDRDNDKHSSNCAFEWKGGWWYNKCHASNLNGIHYDKEQITSRGITWFYLKYKHESLKKASMMIRRQN